MIETNGRKAGSRSTSGGFTLIELVMVLILIGVLSSLGIGLFTSRSAFSPLLAAQQLASATLFAQQAALAGNAGSNVVVSQNADSFLFTVNPGAGDPRVFEMDREGASLSVNGESPPYTASFDASGTTGTATNAQFSFSGDSTYDVCLSSLGAVYAGSCAP